MGSWERGKPANGLRQINIRYQCDDPDNADIEKMLSQATYKNVNKVMKHALMLGCKVLLAQLSGEAPPQTSTSSSSDSAGARKPSAASKAMFDKYGEQ